MTKKAYAKRMAQHEATFDRLWGKMVDDTNDFIKKNPELTFRALNNDGYCQLEHFRDNLCLSGAWIGDRIDGRVATVHSKSYKGSLTKKIRNSLGYTF